MSNRTDTERLDWVENTWGTLAGCVTNVGKGDEWYWRFDHPDQGRQLGKAEILERFAKKEARA